MRAPSTGSFAFLGCADVGWGRASGYIIIIITTPITTSWRPAPRSTARHTCFAHPYSCFELPVRARVSRRLPLPLTARQTVTVASIGLGGCRHWEGRFAPLHVAPPSSPAPRTPHALSWRERRRPHPRSSVRSSHASHGGALSRAWAIQSAMMMPGRLGGR